MVDVKVDVSVIEGPKKKTFQKFRFRGVYLYALLEMSIDELVKLFPFVLVEYFRGGLKMKPHGFDQETLKGKNGGPAWYWCYPFI